jgi:hypothetical protein
MIISRTSPLGSLFRRVTHHDIRPRGAEGSKGGRSGKNRTPTGDMGGIPRHIKDRGIPHRRRELPQTKEGEHGENDDDGADQPDDVVHGKLLLHVGGDGPIRDYGSQGNKQVRRDKHACSRLRKPVGLANHSRSRKQLTTRSFCSEMICVHAGVMGLPCLSALIQSDSLCVEFLVRFPSPDELPLSVLTHLFLSRHCQSDRLDRFARRTVDDSPTGYQHVVEARDWIRDNIDYLTCSRP